MKSNHKNLIRFLILVGLLVIVSILFLCEGTVRVSLPELLHSLCYHEPTTIIDEIIRSFRVPRLVGGMLAGGALAASGLLLQITLNNSLAAPNIIGVNAGAGLAVIVILVLFPMHYALIPLASFVGALTATIIIYLIASRVLISKVTVILAGVAVTGMLNALSNVIVLLSPYTSSDSSGFLYGTLSGIQLSDLTLPAIVILVLLLLVGVLKNSLTVLMLGDTIATSLGVNVRLFRFLFLVISSLLSGSVVSYAGLLGFVGLIVPHMSRQLIGSEIKYLLPFTVFLGSLVVVLSDFIGRMIVRPFELPVGIIMSFWGSPYFIYLLLRQKGDIKQC